MEYRFEEIELDKLKLDAQNPRLPNSYRGKSEPEILEYMILDGSLIELMLAIGKNGYFPGEQLLVVPDGDNFKVIEGNRRLSAVKLLDNPALVNIKQSNIQQVLDETKDGYRPVKIPSLIFETEKEIHDYLGYRHITGIKEWKLLQKARYLNEVYRTNFPQMSINTASQELAKMIGSKSQYVKRLLVGYKLYEKIEENNFFKIPELNDETFHFNYLSDSLNRENIRSFIGIDLHAEDPLQGIDFEAFEKLINWFFRKVYPKPQGYSNKHTKLIADSKSLSDLDVILGNEKAKKAFVEEDKSLPEAIELTSELDKTFSSYIDDAYYSLEQADSIIIKVEKFEGDFDEKVSDIIATARKIKKYKIDKEFEDDED